MGDTATIVTSTAQPMGIDRHTFADGKITRRTIELDDSSRRSASQISNSATRF